MSANVSYYSLMHACSLSASSPGKRSAFLFILFDCALSHYRERIGYYVTLKYQAKPRKMPEIESVCHFKVTRYLMLLYK